MARYHGIVVKTDLAVPHGAYAVARDDTLGLVTFSLDKNVWQEDSIPTEGEYVVMSDIRKKRNGWRACNCRYLRPEDTQETTETTARSTENTHG